jgi:hypothetical protein
MVTRTTNNVFTPLHILASYFTQIDSKVVYKYVHFSKWKYLFQSFLCLKGKQLGYLAV